ncbi:MAG: hypothetical protein ACWGHH_00515 [Sulfurovaceae bacterium]
MDPQILSGIIGICGAIVGSIVGGLFTLRAVEKSFEKQQIQAKGDEKKIIQSLFQAIHDEIESVYDRYQETMGTELENLVEGQALNFYYPIISDYFSVYNGNTFLIGRITDNDLRKHIISTYTHLKGMVDSFRLNNDLVQKFEHSNNIFSETQQEVHKQHSVAYLNSLSDYAKILKTGHYELKQEIENLLISLKKAWSNK